MIAKVRYQELTLDRRHKKLVRESEIIARTQGPMTMRQLHYALVRSRMQKNTQTAYIRLTQLLKRSLLGGHMLWGVLDSSQFCLTGGGQGHYGPVAENVEVWSFSRCASLAFKWLDEQLRIPIYWIPNQDLDPLVFACKRARNKTVLLLCPATGGGKQWTGIVSDALEMVNGNKPRLVAVTPMRAKKMRLPAKMGPKKVPLYGQYELEALKPKELADLLSVHLWSLLPPELA
jgi:hypothetical protein